MAYQAIQMTARPPIFDAMEQLNQSLAGLGQDRRQDAQYADQKKRQEQQDYQAALSRAQALWAKGDYEGAAAHLAPYKARVIQDHQTATAPVSPQGLPADAPPGAGKIPPAPQQAPQGGSPLPDALERANTPEDFDTEHGQTPAQLGQPGPAPAPGSSPSLGALAAAMPPQVAPGPANTSTIPTPSPTQAPAPNPLIAANEATKARDAQRARTLLAFTPPGGQEMRIDPAAAGDRMREQRLAQLDQAMAGVNDPMVSKYYPQLRAAVAASDQPIDPMDALRYIHWMASNEQSGENARLKAQEMSKNLAARLEMAKRRDETSRRNADVGAQARRDSAGILAMGGVKQAQAAGTAGAHLESEFGRWWQHQDVKKITGGTRNLEAAYANITSGNPLAERDAMIQLAKFYRGNTPTEGEMHLLYSNLAGRLGNALPAFLEKMERGGLTPAESEIVRDSIRIAQDEQRKQISNVVRSFRNKFGPGTGHENVAGNVNAEYRSALAGLGLDDDELGQIFTASGGGEVPTVSIGQGIPMVDTKPKAPPKPKPAKPSPPKPADENTQALEWARAHVSSANAEEKAMAGEIMRRLGAR